MDVDSVEEEEEEEEEGAIASRIIAEEGAAQSLDGARTVS